MRTTSSTRTKEHDEGKRDEDRQLTSKKSLPGPIEQTASVLSHVAANAFLLVTGVPFFAPKEIG
jgi:hypothetical protein